MNPLKNSYKSQLLLQFLADIFAIWLGFALQMYVRFFSGLIETFAQPTIHDYVLGCAMMTVFWYTVFFISGMYQNWHLRSPFDEFFALIKTSFFGCLVIVLLILSDNTSNNFRMMFLLYFIIMTSCFIVFRIISRRIHLHLRKKRIVSTPTVIIGDENEMIKFYLQTTQNLGWGININGFIFIEPITEKTREKFIQNGIDISSILGGVDDFVPLIQNSNTKNIIIATSKPNQDMLIDVATICAEKNIRVQIEPNLYEHFTGQSRTQNLYGIPLIEVNTCLLKPWETFLKRTFDITFSIIVLVLGLPLWLIMSIIIKFESEGRIFYSQPRVGKNNKLFIIYKFRSMFQDKCTDGETAEWTKAGDPRVTKFGKFTRKTHLDEIPQFVNVLIGDMSVVGPRPEQPKFVEEFHSQLSYYNRRHLVRPGITGWAQVKSKGYIINIEEIKNRTKDDFYYIENISIRFDFEILVRTVWSVITGSGQA